METYYDEYGHEKDYVIIIDQNYRELFELTIRDGKRANNKKRPRKAQPSYECIGQKINNRRG